MTFSQPTKIDNPYEVDGRRVEAAVIKDNAYEDSELVETTLEYPPDARVEFAGCTR